MSELTPEVDLHNNAATSESPTSSKVDSGTSESSPKADFQNNSSSGTSSPSPELHNSDLVSDIVLWRRKQLNLSILVAATGVWVMMDVYEYNFITLLSWLAIALLSGFFFWGTIHTTILKKEEAPDLSEFEISEENAVEQAKVLRQTAENGIRLVFHVGCEREWFVFAGVVLCLYLLSIVAKHLDFATLCYLGIVGAMSIPAVYVKYKERILKFADKVRMQSRRSKVMIEEKLQKMKNRVGRKPKVVKEKKTK